MEKTSRELNQEKWYACVLRYLSSEQTQASFCKSEQVNKTTFIYWLKKYRFSQEEAEGFVSLSPQIKLPPISEQISLRIGRIELRVPPSWQMDELVSLIKSLSRVC